MRSEETTRKYVKPVEILLRKKSRYVSGKCCEIFKARSLDKLFRSNLFLHGIEEASENKYTSVFRRKK